MPDVEIHGHCEKRFLPVREAFAANFQDGKEIGASVAVVLNGESVVELWAGHKDKRKTDPWQQDTIVNLFSTTKGVTALAAHRLVDEGRLDLDASVASYWPEFAQAGKDKIPVRWLLSHRAGLPGVRRQLDESAILDWTPFTDALAAETPWWEPGTVHGYHAITFGHLVGEVIRRITGKSVGTYIKETFALPLGLDLQIGLAEQDIPRAAPLVLGKPDNMSEAGQLFTRAFADPEGIVAKAFLNPAIPFSSFSSPPLCHAEIPAANGHATALALAKLYGHAALGDGKVISKQAIARCNTEQSFGQDLVLGRSTRFSLGFMLQQPGHLDGHPLGQGAFGHPGAGGSLAFARPSDGLGFGYVMNLMGNRILLAERPTRILDALNECLSR